LTNQGFALGNFACGSVHGCSSLLLDWSPSMLQTRQFITVAGKIRRRGKTGDRVYTQLILTVFAKSRAGRL
jgi:hypothetical protein